MYDIAEYLLGDAERADTLLREALLDPSCAGWAAHVARTRAACSDDSALLALAHEALAASATPEQRAGHLSAAGQAHARRGDWEMAQETLRRALESAPDDAQIMALLEGALREGGRPEDVVALARTRTASSSNAMLGEKSLLLAGAAAERKGDLRAAQEAYEQALLESPESPSAALALADVARRRGDQHTQLRAYERLADGDLGGGVPELFAMLRGDALAFANGGAASASTSYERALDHPITALASAVALLSMPRDLTTDDQRAASEETLANCRGVGSGANGFAAAYAALRDALDAPGASADDAWLQLASLAPTDALRTSTMLHGLREMRIARGENAVDELFMLAHELQSLATKQPHAAMAIDEALAPGDDSETRASALRHKVDHSTAMGRGSLEAARCRALVEADRGAEAIALLSEAIDERPDDLALWETLRVAARQAGQWALVAQACERLARFVDGPLQADLLEEAGAVRLDCLEQHQQAEDAFRSALEADPTREIAFRRLHDLLAEREDAEGLEELVAARLARGGPKDRPDLLYERARLLRGFSDRPGALEVLDELLTSEPDHSGALALAAEVHVSLEQWEQAVDCLRRLSQSGIPDEQRRLAHLGAADFLETRLDAKEEALAELRAVDALGLADAPTWSRIGTLEECLGREGAAIDAYRRALDAEPTQRMAAERLADLVAGRERELILRSYEAAIWARVDAGELELTLLDDLRDAAHWRGDVTRTSAVAAVQAVLGSEARSVSSPLDLAKIPASCVLEQDADGLVEEVMRRAGPAVPAPRVRNKKLAPSDPVYGELERLTERFGARLGSVSATEESNRVMASLGRGGEIHWVVPQSTRNGLDPTRRFVAGRLAWAVPRGGGQLLDVSPDKAAGMLAAILRACRCSVAEGGPVLPAVAIKLPRAIRKSVEEAVGHTVLEPMALVAASRRLHRGADRAGLIACGDIGAALTALSGGTPTIGALRTSER
ncbi:MAG: hypothetical protein JRE81_06815, partial [Deltaproteobacteria bacterium]|nr:hypothetical protein [Deltaproteobacteria bacterium]